jgi:hypothetical protein
MSNTSKARQAEKAKNYSAEQETILQAIAAQAGSVSYSKCCELAEEWGKTSRSVISKVFSLGLPYQPKPKPQKRVTKDATKAELVAHLCGQLHIH